ncbi:YdeI/OmpD-associated family protein [Gelidibacter sp. F2691]|nr:YdeI/OmpD-associated family protein [Gelidibacter sp. F2691]
MKMALKRPIQPMPSDIAARLRSEGLQHAYDQRPPYQQNDYLGWIAQAKRLETRQKRIDQMCNELAGGRLYMKMIWRDKPAGS